MLRRTELLERAGLDEEVGLLAEGLPQLAHDRLQVEELLVAHEEGRVARERAHDRDVLRHDLLHVRALDLDGHELARDEARLVHLRDRRRAQGNVVYCVEDLLDRGVVLGTQGLEHEVSVHRLHVGAQLRKLVAEGLGKDLGAHREDLARLHEGRAELLEELAERLGREPVEDVVVTRDREDLLQAACLLAPRDLVAHALGGAPAEQADGVAPDRRLHLDVGLVPVGAAVGLVGEHAARGGVVAPGVGLVGRLLPGLGRALGLGRVLGLGGAFRHGGRRIL